MSKCLIVARLHVVLVYNSERLAMTSFFFVILGVFINRRGSKRTQPLIHNEKGCRGWISHGCYVTRRISLCLLFIAFSVANGSVGLNYNLSHFSLYSAYFVLGSRAPALAGATSHERRAASALFLVALPIRRASLLTRPGAIRRLGSPVCLLHGTARGARGTTSMGWTRPRSMEVAKVGTRKLPRYCPTVGLLGRQAWSWNRASSSARGCAATA